MWLTAAVTVSVLIQGCWQRCFRTVVRPSIWDKSSDIKIGQWGRPWLVWYVLCKHRCVPRFTDIVMIVDMKHTRSHESPSPCRDSLSVGEPHSAIFTVSDELWLESPIKSLLNVLLQSLASIPQIYQSIYQIKRAESPHIRLNHNPNAKLFTRNHAMCFAEKGARMRPGCSHWSIACGVI